MRRFVPAMALLAASTCAAVSIADDKPKPGGGKILVRVDAGLVAIDRDAGATAPIGRDAGAPSLAETPAQKKNRLAYINKIDAETRKRIRAKNKAVTNEERKLVAKHWNLSMRFLRIRDIAESLNDQGTVLRVNNNLSHLNGVFFQRLDALNAKAPVQAADAGK